MGLFGIGNYNNPGPGVSKDEPPKAAPVRYFEIYGRKFSKLVQANLLVFVPFAVILVLMTLLFFMVGQQPYILLPAGNSGAGLPLNWWAMYVVPAPLILLSPFIGGLTIITRNFAREEHAFIWTDFVKATKGNVKYFLLNGVITYFAYVILSFSFLYYFQMISQGWMYYIPLGLTLMVILLFVFAQYYLPVIFVTFDIKFRQAYKNAFIFAALGMGRNLLLTVLFVGLIVLFIFIPVAYPIMIMVALILFLFFAFSFVSYTTSFATYPLIKKYMIDPANKPAEMQEEAHADKPAIGGSDAEDEDEDDVNEYVYVNGRLIKKSELKHKDE